jgi:hypothetical protein
MTGLVPLRDTPRAKSTEEVLGLVETHLIWPVDDTADMQFPSARAGLYVHDNIEAHFVCWWDGVTVVGTKDYHIQPDVGGYAMIDC